PLLSGCGDCAGWGEIRQGWFAPIQWCDNLLGFFIMALDDILLEAEEKMIKTEEVVQHEFSGVRTGKASPSLVENILVEVYGCQRRIRQVEGITTPEARMLLIQPWDAATVHPIEKAIQKS